MASDEIKGVALDYRGHLYAVATSVPAIMRWPNRGRGSDAVTFLQPSPPMSKPHSLVIQQKTRTLYAYDSGNLQATTPIVPYVLVWPNLGEQSVPSRIYGAPATSNDFCDGVPVGLWIDDANYLYVGDWYVRTICAMICFEKALST